MYQVSVVKKNSIACYLLLQSCTPALKYPHALMDFYFKYPYLYNEI
jgi:hypothetical protein